MNFPRFASFIRRCGLKVARLGRLFEDESASQKQLKRLLSEVEHGRGLDCLTDREIASVGALIVDFEFGTKKSAVFTEMVDRLTRSPLGPNRLDDYGQRIFGIALNVRLIPAGTCDGCHNIGYVCDKSLLCLYCLGLKVAVESRRQKLTGTLRTRFASLAAEVRDKLKSFNTPAK